jgi:hypothetical protein
MQYLLLAMLMLALTACGTTQTAGTASDQASGKLADGKITANLVLAKSAAKSVALAPTVATTRLTVTGPTIPTATANFANNTGGDLAVYPGTKLIVAANAYDSTGALVYEGFATDVTVVSNATTIVTIQLSSPVVKAQDATCLGCHSNTRDEDGQNLVANYKQSGHYFSLYSSNDSKNGAKYPGCAGCHGTSHNVLDPAASGGNVANSSRCTDCHGNNVVAAINANHTAYTAGALNTCGSCHISHNLKGVGCIGCHSVSQDASAKGNFVNDNNGVRVITTEFGKWSHHVTGRSVADVDCAVCHLEGKASGNAVVIDTTYHMVDNNTYLRNCNTGLTGNQSKAVTVGAKSAYPWNPALPDHTLMDQFCFSCHNAGGAPTAIAALSGVAQVDPTLPRSALNPFGDTISNQYDLLSRPAVVDAFGQFDTANSSHHAVRGAKYTSNTLTAAQFSNISSFNAAAYNAKNVIPTTGYVGLKTTPNLTVGTMYQAGAFVTAYTPLGTTTSVRDTSVLHCGDCHTVGQFKPGSSVNADGSATALAIGAHGSENEYMLRKADGSESHEYDEAGGAKDALVCYLCHKASVYGAGNWASGGYPGEGGHAGIVTGPLGDEARECNTDGNNSAGLVGLARIVSESPATSFADPVVMKKLTDGKYAGNGGGNILGMKCANCHNASDKKTFGGIHGNAGNATYTTYSAANKWPTSGAAFTAVQHQPYRFLPGLGNFRYNGGNAANQWTQRSVYAGRGEKKGCYTLNGASSTGTAGGVKPSVWPTKAVLAGANTADNFAGSPTGPSNPYVAGVNGSVVADDNGILGSWGSCSDHAGSSFSGVSETVDRTILRPLTY